MLPEKRQGVFSKDEVINFNDCVKGVRDSPKRAIEVALSKTKDAAQSRKRTCDRKSSGALISCGKQVAV